MPASPPIPRVPPLRARLISPWSAKLFWLAMSRKQLTTTAWIFMVHPLVKNGIEFYFSTTPFCRVDFY